MEATLDGITRYGISQRIYVRGSDETLEAAKSAAQEILNEDGTIKKEITLQSPDVPVIRKGDRIELEAGLTKGSFYVKSVRHEADTCSMSMEPWRDPLYFLLSRSQRLSGRCRAGENHKKERFRKGAPLASDSYGQQQ